MWVHPVPGARPRRRDLGFVPGRRGSAARIGDISVGLPGGGLEGVLLGRSLTHLSSVMTSFAWLAIGDPESRVEQIAKDFGVHPMTLLSGCDRLRSTRASSRVRLVVSRPSS